MPFPDETKISPMSGPPTPDGLAQSLSETRRALSILADTPVDAAVIDLTDDYSWTGAHDFTNLSADDLKLDATGAVYFGPTTTNDSWRIVRSGNDLVFERRESGSWVTKLTITAAT